MTLPLLKKVIQHEEMESSSTIQLTSFLRGLATLIDDNKLESKQLQKISEFYISYKIELDTVPQDDKKQMMKYFTLGYYIYQFLLPHERSIPLGNDQLKGC